MKILVTGSIAYDRIMNFPGYFKDNILPDKIHNLNVSFFIRELRESFGGTAGNIAYNLALLGERPTVLATVGAKDFLVYKKWLQKNKIDLSQVKISANQQTASAYIITDQSDNQITGFYPGVMAKPITSQLKTKNYQLKTNLAIVSPQNPIDMVKLPQIFRAKKIPYIFDPGQQVAILSGPQLRSAIFGSKVLIGNDYEISLITKKTGWPIKKILTQTKTLVITLGEKGSVIYQSTPVSLRGVPILSGRRSNPINQGDCFVPTRSELAMTPGNKEGIIAIKIPPAKPKNTLDPTGAGDAYRAGLIYGLLHNWPWEKIGRLAGLVSVYTVEMYGTQTHKFSWADLAKRYRQNFGEDLV